MSENLQQPPKRGGNRHTFPEDLYSNLGRMVLENPTANHRRMFSRPSIVPLCGILIVIHIIFLAPSMSTGYYSKCNIDLSIKIKNYTQIDKYFPPTIEIGYTNSGRLCFNGIEISENNNSQKICSDWLKNIYYKDEYMRCEIDKNTPWGIVVDTMKTLQNFGIRNVFFVTNELVYPCEVFSDYAGYKERLRREKVFNPYGPLKY